MKEKWTINIPNPLFWLYAVMYRFHKCKFELIVRKIASQMHSFL